MLTLISVALMVSSLAVSVVLTAAVRKHSLKTDFVARPAADRYHRTVIPLGGGLAIYGTLMLFLLAAAGAMQFVFAAGRLQSITDAAGIDPADFMAKAGQLLAVIAAVTVLFLMGWWDDKKSLGPFFKLAVQFAVAIFAAAFGDVRVELFIDSPLITTLLSAFWLVLIMNTFNFLDNMDGAAAGMAVIVSAILFAAAAVSGQVFVGGLALVFIGTMLGFLAFNFPPAKIFMGDSGSLVMGFFLAMLTLRTTYYSQAASGGSYVVLMPLVAMSVPLYDFLSVTFLRISQGKSPFVGDTQHFSHRLRRRGLNDRQTALTLYLATLTTGLGAAFLNQVNLIGAILIFIQTVMVLAIVAIFEMTGANEPDVEA